MCWTSEQADKLMHMYSLNDLRDDLTETPGGMFDYGPEDFKDPAKRRQVVVATLRAMAYNIEQGICQEKKRSE